MTVLKIAKYLGANIIIWGVVLMCHATTTSFGAFFALRFILGMLHNVLTEQQANAFLGMCESCVTPILILIIAMFYKKDEQVRHLTVKPHHCACLINNRARGCRGSI